MRLAHVFHVRAGVWMGSLCDAWVQKHLIVCIKPSTLCVIQNLAWT